MEKLPKIAAIKGWVLKNPKRKYLIIAGLVGICIAVVFFGRGEKVDYYLVQKQDVQETLLANGVLAGDSIVDLRMDTPGQVRAIIADEGDYVQAGDELVALDEAKQAQVFAQQQATFEAAVASRQIVAEGDIPASAARYQQAKMESEYLTEYANRQEQLYQAGGISEISLLAAKRDASVAQAKAKAAYSELNNTLPGRLRLAQAQENQAKAQLEIQTMALRDATLRAPFAGQLVEILVNPGETITSGTVVARMLQTKQNGVIQLNIDESEIGRIKVGQMAYISALSLDGKTIKGQVSQVGSAVDSSTGTFLVQLKINDQPSALVADMTVSAQIIIKEYKLALVVPVPYIIFDASTPTILMSQGGRARQIKLEGRVLGDDFFLVESGLQVGDKVILPIDVAPGAKVRLAKQLNDV